MVDVKVEQTDITSEGLLVTFGDGTTGLIADEDVLNCLEQSDGFKKLQDKLKECADGM